MRRKQRGTTGQSAPEVLIQLLRPEQLGFGRLFYQLTDAVVVVDAETGLIILWNAGAAAIFGYNAVEALGKPLALLLPERHRERHEIGMQRFLATGKSTYIDSRSPVEVPGLTRDGREIVLELTLSRIEDATVPGRFVMALMRDVTERKRLEREVRASELRWRTLVDQAPEIVLEVDRDLRIQFINRTVLPGEVIGRPIFDFLPPEDHDRLRAIYEEVFRTGRPARLETRGLRTDSQWNWYQTSIGPLVHDGKVESVVVLSSDISEVKHTEDILRASREQLAKAQQLAHLGNWDWDQATNVVQWSPELYRIFGLNPATVATTYETYLSLIHPDDLPHVTRTVAEAHASGEPFTFEHRLIRPDGVIRYLHCKGEVITENGRVVRTFGTAQDITEIKVALEELAARTDELQRAREQDHLKSNFVNSVSHELRTPLTSIIGYAEFLEDELGGPLTPEQREFTDEILLSARRLERLVDDLLDFARIDAGTFRLSLAPVDLGAKACEIVASLQPQARAAQLLLEVVIPDAPAIGQMDAQRIGQVLTNLIMNAIKFTPAGGRVRVSVSEAKGWLRCEVSDTGPGIAPEDQQRLFQRFSQLRNSRRKGGAGLGLSISKALMEAHDGQIGVESTPGQGATFWFTLPQGGPAPGNPALTREES